MKHELAKTMRLRRQLLGYTQKELAMASGLSQTFVNMLENSRFVDLKLSHLLALKKTLRFKRIEDLLGGNFS